MGYEKSKASNRKRKKKTGRVDNSVGQQLELSGTGSNSGIRTDFSSSPERIYESDDSEDSGSRLRDPGTVSEPQRPVDIRMGDNHDTGHNDNSVGLRPLGHDGRKEGLDVVEDRSRVLHKQRQPEPATLGPGHSSESQGEQGTGPELLHNELGTIDGGPEIQHWSTGTCEGLTEFIAYMQEFFAEWAAIHSDCMDANVSYPFEEWEVDFYELANGFVKYHYKGLDTPPWLEGD